MVSFKLIDKVAADGVINQALKELPGQSKSPVNVLGPIGAWPGEGSTSSTSGSSADVAPSMASMDAQGT